ncbi:TPA: hypothetical protein DF272_04220 [Candidatus Falkowbacteria bacterium]|nr:hypothetical protein [Candidatus Falkowbacteria bacterium]
MPHKDLGPKLKAILQASKSPTESVNLNTLTPDHVVCIIFGSKQILCVLLTQLPTGRELKQAALGRIIFAELDPSVTQELIAAGRPADLKGEPCLLGGACTRNPTAMFGLSALVNHVITLGRHFYWAIRPDQDDLGLILPETVSKIMVWDKNSFDLNFN